MERGRIRTGIIIILALALAFGIGYSIGYGAGIVKALDWAVTKANYYLTVQNSSIVLDENKIANDLWRYKNNVGGYTTTNLNCSK
jgi:hypothetical protein